MAAMINVNKGVYEMLCALLKQKEKNDFDFDKAAAETGLAKSGLDTRWKRFRKTLAGDPNGELGSVCFGAAVAQPAPRKSAPYSRAAVKRKAKEIDADDEDDDDDDDVPLLKTKGTPKRDAKEVDTDDEDDYVPTMKTKGTPIKKGKRVENVASADEEDDDAPLRKAKAAAKGKGKKVQTAISSEEDENYGVPIRKATTHLKAKAKKTETDSDDEVFDSKARIETDSEEELFNSNTALLKSHSFQKDDTEDEFDE